MGSAERMHASSPTAFNPRVHRQSNAAAVTFHLQPGSPKHHAEEARAGHVVGGVPARGVLHGRRLPHLQPLRHRQDADAAAGGAEGQGDVPTALPQRRARRLDHRADGGRAGPAEGAGPRTGLPICHEWRPPRHLPNPSQLGLHAAQGRGASVGHGGERGRRRQAFRLCALGAGGRAGRRAGWRGGEPAVPGASLLSIAWID